MTTWIVISYLALAFLVVSCAAPTALWAGSERRKDAYRVLKLGLGLVAGGSGIGGVLLAVARREMI